jgi:hypothetical protein
MRKATIALLTALSMIWAGWPAHAQQYAASFVAGRRVAALYGYGFNGVPGAHVAVGNSATGAQTVTVCPAVRALPDGRVINLFQAGILNPVTFDLGTATSETVTPTAVSVVSPGGLTVEADQNCAAITATFSFTHAPSQFPGQVRSGTFGLQEAINDAAGTGGGIVAIDSTWGGTNAMIAAAIPYVNVSIEDTRSGVPQYWNVVPTASTFLATPTTLTAVTALPSAAPVGAYGTGTYHLAIAYVDVAGQVGPESADFSEAGLATGSFIFSPPAASAGAVGYVIYISLTSGTYSLDYEVPLTASVCKLTTVETVTPACAVANTTYNQAGATATVTAITVNTSPVGMLLGGVSGTLLTGNPNGRTTYSYVASSHVASFGIPTMSLPFTVGGIGSATPIAIGTVNIPAGVLNQVGKRIRLCGHWINTDVNSAVQNINIYLDAAGSDVAGSPVKIGSLASTQTGTAAPYQGNFCEEFTTTVSGAGATAGSIQPGYSNFLYVLTSANTVFGTGADTNTAAVASLNLAGGGGFENRLSIVHTNTTGNATPQLISLTIEVL